MTRSAERALVAGYSSILPEKVQHKLIRANLRLVPLIAHKFHRRYVAWEELIAAGNFGLVRAAKTFDVSWGVRFATYATEWVKEYVRRVILQYTYVVRAPYRHGLRGISERIFDIEYVDECNPQDNVIEEQIDQRTLIAAMNEQLPTLTPRERLILRHRYELDGATPLTYGQIGDRLGFSRERARQIEGIALQKLRAAVDR